MPGCATDKGARSFNVGNVPLESISTEIRINQDCETVNTIICEDILAPVHCKVSRYSGGELSEKDSIHAWENNECKAKKQIGIEACKRELSPPNLEGLSCRPSSAVENCPPKMSFCIAVHKPVRCKVKTYNGEALSDSQLKEVTASNQCEAHKILAMEFCKINLDPNKIGELVCMPPSEPVDVSH